MSIQTNLQGRLRNTSLPKSHGLLPVFEAIVNSIHSIEEQGNLDSGEIELDIIRDNQSSLNLKKDQELRVIQGFIIKDTGIGFNEANMKSFETLDSDHKIEKGCRGVGRLIWLKAFKSVTVSSIFRNKEGNLCKREFNFDEQKGIQSKQDITKLDDQKIQTIVQLQDFNKTYQTSTPKTLEAIAKALLEHCLWYFVRPESDIPKIKIRDGKKELNLHDLYEAYMYPSISTEEVELKKENFTLTHIKFRTSFDKKHTLSLCANNRLVKEESIVGKLPGLYGKITDSNGDFFYACYVSSTLLDKQVRSERTSFEILEDSNDIFSNAEISLKDMRERILISVQNYLSEYLEVNKKASAERIGDFISKKAPRYRPIMHYINEDDLNIDPNISDKDLELHLHKSFASLEQQLISQGYEVMTLPIKEELQEEYNKKLGKYLQMAEDVKKSDLASYVSHRRTILDLLEKSIQRTKSGKYACENVIHELIMPMRKDSNEVFFDSCNLWLVDERLAFHNYLASDKTLHSIPITGDNSTKEFDICALNVYDNPIIVSERQSLPLASITVIEIKRPMRNDAKIDDDNKNPILQAINYLNKIRKGQVKTASGRLIPNSEDIPGYCYIICDITETVKTVCEMANLDITSDHMGYFGFNKNYKAYIEVISYDRLVNAARERNRAFFDKLGLPAN